MSYVDDVLTRVANQNPDQPEFNQAVTEVLESLRPAIEQNEERYRKEALLERLTTPDRQILFRVSWVDDKGQKLRSTTHTACSSTMRSDRIRAGFAYTLRSR